MIAWAPMSATLLALLLSGQEAGLWERETLLGDAWGSRPFFAEFGTTLTLNGTAEVFSCVHGGLDTGTEAESLLDLVVEADLDKMLGWSGGRVKVNPLWIEGAGASRDRVGDFTRVSNIDARDEVRIFEVWLEQSFFDGAAVLRGGLLAADQEYLLSEASGLFLNGSFGMPVFVSVNIPSPVYPLGAPGLRLHGKGPGGWEGAVTVYDGDPGREHENETGGQVRFHDEEGVLGLAEIAWKRGGTAFKAGAFLHTGRFLDQSSGELRRGLHGFFGMVEQKLGGSVACFVRAGAAPEDRTLIEVYADAGLTVTGLLPGRGKDVAGVGVVWAELGGDYAATIGGDREVVVEFAYRVVVSPWWHLIPDLQYVHHPGGSTENDDAWVVALRLDLWF